MWGSEVDEEGYINSTVNMTRCFGDWMGRVVLNTNFVWGSEVDEEGDWMGRINSTVNMTRCFGDWMGRVVLNTNFVWGSEVDEEGDWMGRINSTVNMTRCFGDWMGRIVCLFRRTCFGAGRTIVVSLDVGRASPSSQPSRSSHSSSTTSERRSPSTEKFCSLRKRRDRPPRTSFPGKFGTERNFFSRKYALASAPEVKFVPITDTHRFICLCCDGLFEVFTSKELIDRARELQMELEGTEEPKAIAKRISKALCKEAYDRGSEDN